jgi:hypothetical protein
MLVGLHADNPGGDQAGDDDHLTDGARELGPDPVDQNPVDHSKQCSRQHRQGDHEPLLRRIEPKGRGDLHAQGAEQHPDHEAHVEIEEGGEQGRRMAGLHEVLGDHHGASFEHG